MSELRTRSRPTTKHADADKEAQVRILLDDWVDAIRNKDARRVTSHFAPGAVLYTLAPPLQATAQDSRDLQAWFDTWRGPIDGEVRDLKLTIGDQEGFCTSLNRMRGTKTNGQVVDMWFRQTLGFRKIDGDWKIVHEHTSVPFYMDGTFKAAVDLKP